MPISEARKTAWPFHEAGLRQHLPEPSAGAVDATPVERLRTKWLQFQALITAVLSAQVLSGLGGSVPHAMVWAAILWMLALCGLLIVLPGRTITAEWFSGLLGGMDIVAIAILVSISGHPGPDLYLAYFAILLIVTTMRIPVQMAAFVVLVTVIYGCAPYGMGEYAEGDAVRHVARMSVLLGLALVYHRRTGEAHLVAESDPVTKLPTRRQLLHWLSGGMRQGQNGAEQILLYIDIVGFSRVNEAFGHSVGDRLLAATAERIKSCLRQTDVIARVGPDDFAVWLLPSGTSALAKQIAQHICDAMKVPVVLEEREIVAEVYIGIASTDSKRADRDSLLINAAADAARCAHAGERGGYSCFTSGIVEGAMKRLRQESRLYRAVEREELVVHYQPIIHLGSHQVVGVEALARWQDPELGLVLPETFISLAEETGLIVPIGEAVLRQACRQLRLWRHAGYPSIQLAVNLSPRQFHRPDLADRIAAVLADVGGDPACLNLEVTESCLMKDAEAGLWILGRLKAVGVRLSLDDFGTGYSSLLSLKRFPIDTLKIDRVFTHDMVSSPSAAAIVRAILGLAAAMQLVVIAEGVETESQAAMLLRQDCVLAQGYAFSQPVSAEELTAWFADRRGLKKATRVHGAAA